MKITKARLKEIIKEEVQKIIEGKRPPGMRKRTMKDLDDEAKTRETDFLKKKEKEEEEEELDETSMMSGLPVGDVAGHSGPAKKKAPLEEDGWDEPHV